MSTQSSVRISDTVGIGALAGIGGGLAEVIWVGVYGAVTGTSMAPVTRGIVASVVPSWAHMAWSAALGLVIHMVLAIALGVGLALLVRVGRRPAGSHLAEWRWVLPTLAAVWAVNFLAALPHINPQFVRLLPYGVTFISKLLFGVSAATVLRAARLRA